MLVENSHETSALVQRQVFYEVFNVCGVLNVEINNTIVKNVHIFLLRVSGWFVGKETKVICSRRIEKLKNVSKIK